MKFAHIADCHIGSWRDPLLEDLSTIAFEKAIDKIIEEKVDFVLIAGDLFNTALPPVEKLKRATKKLKELKDNDIPVYMIAGSHDYSPSGKTMLDVLENAGLAVNVSRGEDKDGKLKLKFTIDEKTGAKITGLLGRMGGLDRNLYEVLDRESLEKESGYKIFLFHNLLTELKPKNMEKVDSQPTSLLPKNFDYYAGGHPHFVFSEKVKDYGIISYTGPLFPNSFSEIEELHQGCFFIVEDNNVKKIPIKLYDVECIEIDAHHKTPEEVENQLKKMINDGEFTNKIITLRIFGTLEFGRPSDINFRELFNLFKEKGAYVILKNTSSLTSKEFEEIKIEISDTEELENNLVKEHISKEDLHIDATELTKKLLKLLDTSKQEGETVATFENRIKEDLNKLMKL